MSAFEQGMKKLGLRAGLLAGASAAVLAISGLGAGSAMAAPTCPSNAVSAIEGQGSSLQRISQELWTGREVPSNPTVWPALPHAAKSGGYAATCGTSPSVSYTSTGSAAGIKSLGYTGSAIQNGAHGEPVMSFAGSDDGPSVAQIANAESVAGGANALIIPVSETSIAVVVHPPAGCSFTSNSSSGISYTELNEIFSGTLKDWGNIGAASGSCAGKAITRVVREDGSGTSFQFKNYLSELEKNPEIEAVGPGCASETGASTWAELRPIVNTTTSAPNTTWPKCESRSAVVVKNGGGGVAEFVAANAGTIGYAALPDAKGKGATVAAMQNQGSFFPTFANPEGSTGETANCGSRVYTVPAAGREGASGESVDWSEVFGAEPEIGGELYPLCTLTYDLAWNGYSAAGYSSPAARAEDVKAYINYILNEAQSPGHYYQALPQPGIVANNVLGAAKLAASHIG